MTVLFIADIVGRPGRQAVFSLLPRLYKEYQIDFCIANAENASGGRGLTGEIAQSLHEAGIDVLTSGNHIWDQREIFSYLETSTFTLRPANYPPGVSGFGSIVSRTKSGIAVGVLNIQGRSFMPSIDCPFRTAIREWEHLRDEAAVLIVDFHAEASAEKAAMGWYLDGKVSAVIGTHTHVQTADERLLPKGTAYITDAGMTGPYDSVIGIEKEAAIRRFLTGLPTRFEPAREDVRLCGVLLGLDEKTGKALSITRVMRYMDE